MKVGFIGLGAMGSAMASNLVAGGHAVTAWNRSDAATEKLVSLGAKAASTPDRAAQGDVLHSMLANDQAVREVFIDGGLLDAMDPGIVHVNHATISVGAGQTVGRGARQTRHRLCGGTGIWSARCGGGGGNSTFW